MTHKLPARFEDYNTEDKGATQRDFDNTIERAHKISKRRECEVYVVYDWQYFEFMCLTEHDSDIENREVYYTVYPD